MTQDRSLLSYGSDSCNTTCGGQMEAENSDHTNVLPSMSNTYYAMRHGRSLANDEGLIVSYPEHGVPGYGLTDDGKRQVAAAITGALRDGVLDQTTVIAASDFARARESAEIAASLLGTQDIILTPKLRESTLR